MTRWLPESRRAFRAKLHAKKYPHLAKMSDRERWNYERRRGKFGRKRALELAGRADLVKDLRG